MYSHADIAGWASVAVLAVLIITSDLRSRRVPNWLVAVGLVLSIVLVKFGTVMALAYDWRDVWLGGAIALASFLPLYALGWMGAGDVKFFTVAGLLAGWHGLVAIWLVSSVLAGVHALAILLLRRVDASAPSAWMLMRVCPALARWDPGHAGRRGIPYAAYMAIGLLSLPWLPDVMRVPWLPGM
ncbi:prepilin peptidase transmembrane protein [Ralstonia solanacearum]|uniref:Prepilin peptidase transmembrane protein (CpaA) n=1 Tax=Ralstonia solanacearum CFBP2957 TaxID=859656 RepID=D8P533_RALSL|nr:prepilin peptidase transmembrane protein [Ralstonia solanacearum]CBJ54019.1 prepilin peptidase transmembrane protein (cpaA) [Ralstonia solanacearum CFBP2957]